MAKTRVYEVARELGIDSKTAVAKLQELGEFVKSASSTIEPPVARKLRDAYPDAAEAAVRAGCRTAGCAVHARQAARRLDTQEGSREANRTYTRFNGATSTCRRANGRRACSDGTAGA